MLQDAGCAQALGTPGFADTLSAAVARPSTPPSPLPPLPHSCARGGESSWWQANNLASGIAPPITQAEANNAAGAEACHVHVVDRRALPVHGERHREEGGGGEGEGENRARSWRVALPQLAQIANQLLPCTRPHSLPHPRRRHPGLRFRRAAVHDRRLTPRDATLHLRSVHCLRATAQLGALFPSCCSCLCCRGRGRVLLALAERPCSAVGRWPPLQVRRAGPRGWSRHMLGSRRRSRASCRRGSGSQRTAS